MTSHIAPTELPAPTHTFTQLFGATPRGARVARLMTVRQLALWGWPHGHEVSEAVTAIVAELTANAATHGRAGGHAFQLRLVVGPGLLQPATLRVEVADACGGARPDPSVPARVPGPEEESGRGLLLVDAFATRWGVADRLYCGKTVWAELDLTVSPADPARPAGR
ncbi:ATP-binding protein [Streptomyces sp. TRM 70361]|uniref:ATP-binding protein n=1 Tax=Streptomyces sp. TRM 70361 TaxID=3116553 RepID=UPI002E7BE82A|nr:ATP-binding protein [Streptomyces sp. TRM 70361]MEE1942153.1 ATP-binding protein [Streptomyces sp. TRM 70361]